MASKRMRKQPTTFSHNLRGEKKEVALMPEGLTLGSLFDGIGGWCLAAVRAGIRPIWSSEIEKFPLEVTARHFPDVVQLGDVTKIDGAKIEPVDIICAGSPCQDLSVAGKRAGLAGERSGLFVRAVDIVRQMRVRTNGKYPRFFVWENVPGAFSSNHGRDFQAVLAEIGQTDVPMPQSGRWATAGMVRTQTADIAWRVLDAQYWGVPQRRKRIFLVADFASAGRCADKILFEPEGVSGNTQAGTGAGEGAPGGVESGARTASAGLLIKNSAAAGGIGYTMEQSPTLMTDGQMSVLQPKPVMLKIRQPRNEKLGGHGAMWKEDQAYTLATHQDQTLFQNGMGPEDVQGDTPQGGGTRKGAPGGAEGGARTTVYGICSMNSNSMKSSNPNSGIYKADTSRTLDLNGGTPACNQGGMMIYASKSYSEIEKAKVTASLRASGGNQGGGSENYVVGGSV